MSRSLCIAIFILFLTTPPLRTQVVRTDMAQTNGSVLSVAESGGVFYIGGTFTSVINPDGSVVARNRIAAIDASTGYATGWNPGADNDVVTIAPGGGVIYIGGAFMNAGGQARSRAAAIDAATGLATAWDPQPNGTVFSMILSGSTVYMGGAFFQIAGTNRFFLGAVSASGTGALLAWNPSADNFVYSLAQSGSTIYAGGTFLTIGGFGRPRIAAIDALSGAPTAWIPGSNNIVLNVVSNGATVYASGFFTTIGGSARQGLAALDAATGLATGWNPNCNNGVLQAVLVGSRVIAGGAYTSIGGAGLQNLSSLDAVTGASTLWSNPNTNGQIEFNGLANVAGEPTVLVGGQFTSIGGQTRGYFAVLDQPTPTALFSLTTFVESPTNNGTVGPSSVITLDRTTWLPPAGTTLVSGVHYTVSGLPSGLTLFARVLNNLSVQIFLTGQATNSAAANSVSNVQITFTNAAVQNGNVASIAGLNTQALRIRFIDSAITAPPPPISPPTITSFTPNTGTLAAKVQIRGTGFSAVRSIAFGGIPASAFTIDADSLITATVGAGGTGFIGVTTPDGTVFSPSPFTYTFISQPLITGISQTFGSFGTRITLSGQGFGQARGVRFGGLPALNFTIDSDTQITAIVGSNASGNISILTADGEIFYSGADFTYLTPQTPQITATSPEPVVTGDENFTLTVIGRNLPFFGQYDVLPLDVRTAQQPITVTAQDVNSTATTLSIPLALRQKGAYRLSLRLGDVVISTTFTVALAPPPRIATQNIVSTIASGQPFTVMLSGTGFFRQNAARVTLNGTLAEAQVMSSSEAAVRIPREMNILGSTLRIGLTNFDGQSTEATVQILSRTGPLITSLQPQWYQNPDGSPRLEFVVQGAGFQPPLKVIVANRPVAVLRATSGEITLLIPTSFYQPMLTEPPVTLLLENADTQGYGWRIAPQAFYPVLPQIDRPESLLLEQRGRVLLIGLPMQGIGFQPGIRARIDGTETDILSSQFSRCIVGIPQSLAFPLQPDKPYTLILTNPGNLSTIATVFLRFDTTTNRITAEGAAADTEELFPANTIHDIATTETSSPTAPTAAPVATAPGKKNISYDPSSEMWVFPNPTEENITLDISRLQNSAERLILYDVCGKIAYRWDVPLHTTQFTVSLTMLPSGYYTLELHGNGSVTRAKVMKL